MTKIIRSKAKICRTIGSDLWGRTNKKIRKSRPGQHGAKSGSKKLTDYGVQLSEKQKFRLYYGDIREKQFYGIYKEAARKRGDTIENLVGLLESRLDAFIFRTNFAPTIHAARQIISHKRVKVNKHKVNIRSYVLKPGDVVEITDEAKQMKLITDAITANERPIPEYIEMDIPNMSAKYLKVPMFEEIPYAIEMHPHLVIQFYSRS